MRGGQRRTVVCGCDRTFRGHPNEVNKLYERHRRYCERAIQVELPEYNRITAKKNGWKGMMPNGDKPKKLIADVFTDSERNVTEVHTNNIEDVKKEIRQRITDNDILIDDDTLVCGIMCKTCKFVLPPMTVAEHLDKDNVKNTCLCVVRKIK